MLQKHSKNNFFQVTLNLEKFPQKGKGFGKQLLDTIIARIKLQIMPVIDCRYLIVDSKKNAIGFYERNGFALLKVDKDEGVHNPHYAFEHAFA
jgi:hypothetical protein